MVQVKSKVGFDWRTLEVVLYTVTGKLAAWHHLQTVPYLGRWKPRAVLLVTGGIVRSDVSKHVEEFLLLSILGGVVGQDNYS